METIKLTEDQICPAIYPIQLTKWEYHSTNVMFAVTPFIKYNEFNRVALVEKKNRFAIFIKER